VFLTDDGEAGSNPIFLISGIKGVSSSIYLLTNNPNYAKLIKPMKSRAPGIVRRTR